MEWSFQTAEKLVTALRAGEVTSVELTDEAIARIERDDEMVNAICVPDFDRARAAAHRADQARARGEDRPLLGVAGAGRRPGTITDGRRSMQDQTHTSADAIDRGAQVSTGDSSWRVGDGPAERTAGPSARSAADEGDSLADGVAVRMWR
jgi:hypothetical protein